MYQTINGNIFDKLMDIITNNPNYEDFIEQLFIRTKNMLNDYKLYNDNITKKIEIFRNHYSDYNQAIKNYFNSFVNQIKEKLNKFFCPIMMEGELKQLKDTLKKFVEKRIVFQNFQQN